LVHRLNACVGMCIDAHICVTACASANMSRTSPPCLPQEYVGFSFTLGSHSRWVLIHVGFSFTLGSHSCWVLIHVGFSFMLGSFLNSRNHGQKPERKDVCIDARMERGKETQKVTDESTGFCT
jgi:hypothetical protein